MINIFKCPYYEECNKFKPKVFYAEDILEIEFSGCRHPFLKHGDDALCGLSMNDDGDYDKIVSQITLNKRRKAK